MDRHYDRLKATMNLVANLNNAVKEAHGTEFSMQQLDAMTALELLSVLTGNDIFFRYIGEKEEDAIRSN